MVKRIHGINADHLDNSASLHQLGKTALMKGDLDEAEKHYKNCLKMLLRMYTQHAQQPHIAICLHSLRNLALKREMSSDEGIRHGPVPNCSIGYCSNPSPLKKLSVVSYVLLFLVFLAQVTLANMRFCVSLSFLYYNQLK